MATWNETEYEKRAGEVARQFMVDPKVGLNSLSEKMARDENLNPDEIRTLVRLANVATFQALFKKKDDGDKMIEFEPGDPEQVINRMQGSTLEGQPPQTANIMNDKLASYILPDQMREKRLGQKFEVVTTKVASDYVPRAPRREFVLMQLQKVASQMDILRRQADFRFDHLIMEIGASMRKVGAQTFADFEKDAFSEYGEAVFPEVTAVAQYLRQPAPVLDTAKVAELQEYHLTSDSKQMDLLKEAFEARQDYDKCQRGIEWATAELKKIGG